MSEQATRPIYMATLTIRVPLLVDPSKRIGGDEYTTDQIAAWEAAVALGCCTGDDVWEQIGEGGYGETILGLAGEVTRLERMQADQDVEPNWSRVVRLGGERPSCPST